MTKKLKSGTPFVYDENDRVVGIRDPHTGTDTDLVTAVMGPGGGIASLTAGAYPLWLQGASLLDRVPLPRMRPILTPRDVNMAAAVIPDGASISIESAPDEMYGECIRIDLPSGLTTTTGRIHLPIRQLVGVGFPRALLRSELRIHVDDWSKLGACLFYLSQSARQALRLVISGRCAPATGRRPTALLAHIWRRRGITSGAHCNSPRGRKTGSAGRPPRLTVALPSLKQRQFLSLSRLTQRALYV